MERDVSLSSACLGEGFEKHVEVHLYPPCDIKNIRSSCGYPPEHPRLLFANIIISGYNYPLLLCLFPLAFALEDTEPRGLTAQGTRTPTLEGGV